MTSTNSIVASAINARARNAVEGGRYEVTLESVTLDGNYTKNVIMTDAKLQAWLGAIHSKGIYDEAISRFARGDRYFDANLDMHPTVHIRPV